MNLLADEGVDRQVVVRLRQEGYRVLYIAEVEPGRPGGNHSARSQFGDAKRIQCYFAWLCTNTETAVR